MRLSREDCSGSATATTFADDTQCQSESSSSAEDSTTDEDSILVIKFFSSVGLLVCCFYYGPTYAMRFVHSATDVWLVSKSDEAARKMNLATNAEVFQHSLNRFPETVRDPRSQMQRLEDPTLTNDKPSSTLSLAGPLAPWA